MSFSRPPTSTDFSVWSSGRCFDGMLPCRPQGFPELLATRHHLPGALFRPGQSIPCGCISRSVAGVPHIAWIAAGYCPSARQSGEVLCLRGEIEEVLQEEHERQNETGHVEGGADHLCPGPSWSGGSGAPTIPWTLHHNTGVPVAASRPTRRWLPRFQMKISCPRHDMLNQHLVSLGFSSEGFWSHSHSVADVSCRKHLNCVCCVCLEHDVLMISEVGQIIISCGCNDLSPHISPAVIMISPRTCHPSCFNRYSMHHLMKLCTNRSQA